MGLIKQSRISHRKVSRIEQCFCLDIDATRTAVLASVNRKTANRFFSYFRLAIYWHQVNELRKVMGPVVGEAECDEAYFGAKRVRGFHGKSKRGRGTSKQPVFGIFERGGRVFTELVPDCKKKTLQALILGRVSKEAVVYTDSWRGYDGLVDIGYDRHVRINHRRDEFSRGNGVHVNGIESFWSFTKRRLAKFNGVKRNFPLHLKECEWRWKRSADELRDDLEHVLRR